MGMEKRELMMHASKCYAVVFTKLCSDFKKKKKGSKIYGHFIKEQWKLLIGISVLAPRCRGLNDLNGSSGKGKRECKKKQDYYCNFKFETEFSLKSKNSIVLDVISQYKTNKRQS